MSDIPQKYVDAARLIIAAVKSTGATRASGTIDPGFKEGWRASVTWLWEAGRHGEDSGRLVLQSHPVTHVRLDTTA